VPLVATRGPFRRTTVSLLRSALSHPWAFRGLFLIGFVLAAVPVFLGVLNPDGSCLLNEAERVLDGAVLYSDIVELNPPLIVWLNLLPVLAARLLGCSQVLAFRV